MENDVKRKSQHMGILEQSCYCAISKEYDNQEDNLGGN